MRYNKSKIMTKAWMIFRKVEGITFAEALRRAWASAKARIINEARIIAAAAQMGITETVHSWSEWREQGFMVRHGEHAVFTVELIWASRGPGKTRKTAFFKASQTEEIQPTTA